VSSPISIHYVTLVHYRQYVSMYQHNSETRLRYNSCRGKAISIAYSVCVCVCSLRYPACKTHAPYYIVICGLSGCAIFLYIISYTAQFSKKKITEHKMCVLIFSTLLSETFLILRIIQRDIIVGLHVKCLLLVGF